MPRSGRSSRRRPRCSLASTPRCWSRPGRRGGRGPLEAVDRQLLAPAGVRGRPDRHQGHCAGRLRPLRRGAVPHRARRMERAERFDLRGGIGRPAGHDGDPPVDAGARRPGGGGSPAVRRRRARSRPAGTPISPRSTASPSATIPSQGVVRGTDVHPSEARLRLRSAGRLHAREPDGRPDRRRRSGRPGVAARQHSDRRFDARRDARSPPAGSTASRRPHVETMQIGGLEAATAVAQGEQWSFRLGAVRLNGRLYRLIFAARSLSPAVDERFRASLAVVPPDQRAGFGARGGSSRSRSSPRAASTRRRRWRRGWRSCRRRSTSS